MGTILFMFCCLLAVMLLFWAVLDSYKSVDSDDILSILTYISVKTALLFLLAAITRKLIVLVSVL